LKEISKDLIDRALQKGNNKVENKWLNSIKKELNELQVKLRDIEERMSLKHLQKNEGNFIFKLKTGNGADVQKITGHQMFHVNA